MKNIKNLFLFSAIMYFVNYLSLEAENSGASIVQKILEQCNSRGLSDEKCMEYMEFISSLFNIENPNIMQILIEQCKENQANLEYKECIAFMRAKILQKENVSSDNNDTQE